MHSIYFITPEYVRDTLNATTTHIVIFQFELNTKHTSYFIYNLQFLHISYTYVACVKRLLLHVSRKGTCHVQTILNIIHTFQYNKTIYSTASPCNAKNWKKNDE
jgi:hypothetical protein